MSGCGDGNGPGGSGSGDDGPLAKFFGWDERDYDERPETSEEERQKQYRVEELVAECMADQGFEYIPRSVDDHHFSDGPFDDFWSLQLEDPEEFAKLHGYGWSTQPEWEPGPEGENEYKDPNSEIWEQLTPAAQEEYDKALWGDWSDYEWPDEDDEGTAPLPVGGDEPSGCYDEARQEVYNYDDSDDGGWEQFEHLYEEWEKLYERIENDSRLTGAKQAWADCMADAGFPGFTQVQDAQDSVHDRMAEVYGWGGEGEDYAPDYDPDAEYEEPQIDEAALEDLRAHERSVGYADFLCQRDHYESAYREARDDLENAFIDDHRADLEAYRDFMATMERGVG